MLDNTWTVYLDGSLLDGPSKELGRVGFGFAALDCYGRTMASAYGIPPDWITTIHGAEVWALHAASAVAIQVSSTDQTASASSEV